MYIKFLAFRRFLRRQKWLSSGGNPTATALPRPHAEAYLSVIFPRGSQVQIHSQEKWLVVAQGLHSQLSVSSALGLYGVHATVTARWPTRCRAQAGH